MVLHIDRDRAEIMIYVSEQVRLNILNPIMTEKPLFNNDVVCDGSIVMAKRYHKQFNLFSYKCVRSDTRFSVAVLLEPASCPPEMVDTSEEHPIYFGIKNRTIKTYTRDTLQKDFAAYLL